VTSYDDNWRNNTIEDADDPFNHGLVAKRQQGFGGPHALALAAAEDNTGNGRCGSVCHRVFLKNG
jgi:hypothetical protein